jgi:hypothetical protein
MLLTYAWIPFRALSFYQTKRLAAEPATMHKALSHVAHSRPSVGSESGRVQNTKDMRRCEVHRLR